MGIQVDPRNVVGRDRLIDHIWRKLAKSSIRFTAEKRTGKTTVMRNILAERQPGTELIFIDLEKVDSPHRFTEVMLTEMKPWLSRTQKAAGLFQGFLADIEGVEIAGVIKIPDGDRIGWKAMLEKTFARVCSHQPDTLLVLLLDELPYMLQKIAAKEKRAGTQEHAALEILDTLRAMRAQHANLRMIFAGSVGLHHVLTDLRATQLASQPVNDMPLVPIEALSLPDAVTLAKRLRKDEGVPVVVADEQRLPRELASLTDRVPFYLERVVARLAELDGPVSVEHAYQVVRQQMTDDRDAWEMEHFRSRLEIYYPGTSTDANGRPITNESVARALLDLLAVASTPQTIDQVWAAMKAQMALDDRHAIVRLLTSLAQDHYLTADTEKRYAFRFPLIRQWWVLAQGLSS